MKSIKTFWLLHPGLYFGLMAFIGVSFAISNNVLSFFPLLFMLYPLFQILRSIFGILLAFSCYAYAACSSSPINLKDIELHGTGYFQVESVGVKSSHFGKSWIYKGTLKSFAENPSDSAKVYNISCSINLPQKEDLVRPPAMCDYLITGRLKQSENGAYYLVPHKQSPWLPISGSWRTAELRLQAKQAVSTYIHHHYTFLPCVNFLSGIATGDFDDRILAYEFSRFGLQHIMAISGFHFAIVAGILSVLLGMLFKKRMAIYLLLTFLSLYFLFLGYSPSIFRAWMMALIPLCGQLMKRTTPSLNSLGIALLMNVIYDPYSIQSLGFQFSYASTAAILFLFRPCDHFFKMLFPLRSLSQMVGMNYLNQHGYCFLTFFRQAFALTTAVNLIAIPMTLFHFQKFPIMSLIFNLFFPFFVSISIFLLIVGMLLSFIPYIGGLIHWINDFFTRFVLNFTYNFPPKADFFLRWTLPGELISLYLSLFLFLSLFLYAKQREKEINHQDCLFI